MTNNLFTIIYIALSSTGLTDGPIAITPLSNAPKGFSNLFSKQVIVFDIPTYATIRTSDAKVLHCANVLAQYLDNDADGKADNEMVVGEMRKRRAAMIMFATERSFERIDIDRYISGRVLDSMALQTLFGKETIPNGATRGKFDATLEEVFHLITHAGYAHAYPKVFGEARGTELTKAMDIARGGYFSRVPRRYPNHAYYTYYDRTCDYECQAVEYIYWGITSILGAQEFQGRFEVIRYEWRLNTANKIKERDPRLYELLTHPRYKLPTVLPNGNYRPKKTERH